MMIRKTVPLLLAFALSALAQNGRAQTNLLPVTFSAVCTSSNANGLLNEKVGNINLIDDCAFENNLTNLDSLRLVFNVTDFSVQVVDTNGVAVCTSLAFPDGLTFTNIFTNITHTASNTTEIVFQHNVLVETNLTASGVISGFATWNGSDMSSFRLSASLLYTEPANGTNGPEICRAVLSAGKNQKGDRDENGDGKGDDEDNGNHLGRQNPQNPHSGQ